MIKNEEKKLVHIYKTAAGLSDPEYRAALVESTGKRSCADPEFSHSDVDCALASLEGLLFDRVARGLCADPRGRSRWIKDEWHFRARVSRHSSGLLSPRQEHLLMQLWKQLSEFLDDYRCNQDYLDGLVAQAVGKRKLISSLSHHEAAFVIDALQDRLRYAIKSAKSQEGAAAGSVPF